MKRRQNRLPIFLLLLSAPQGIFGLKQITAPVILYQDRQSWKQPELMAMFG
jgi:hypothetical protein